MEFVDIAPDAVLAWLDEGRECALATVVGTWGSSPRPVGSQMLVDNDGNFEGSVSGGCVEGAVVTAAREALAERTGRVLEFGVSDNDAWEVGLACGGTIRVFVAPCPERSVLSAIAAAYAQKQPAVLVTSLTDNSHRLAIDTLDPLQGELRVACAQALRMDTSRYLESGDERLFVKVYSLPLRLLVIGAVHIAKTLIPIAAAAGYEVMLIDPRRAFASRERFPDAQVTHEWPDVALQRLRPDRRTAVVTLSHDSKLDEPALQRALASDAFYVGALGSRRTHAARCKRLLENGVAEDAIARIHAPIGLDIGAATPVEIAVSIIAEITSTLRRRPDG
ncbi:MAG: XdhC family protein [Gammaproteobacteria bacterium]|nr:XdhC family protein [Gammaproteobacteria bacterium]